MAKNVKTVLIPIVVVVVAAGAAYGAGRWQGRQQTEKVQEELDSTRADLTAQLTATKAKLTKCTQKADQLEARRQLHMAMEELSALNFGYAEKHLKNAANILASSAPEGSDLAKLAQGIKDTRIQPSGQLDQQRQVLRHLTDQFDQLVPSAEK